MATYAGFQKYDTPNLGNDAANMLIQKQQMDAQKAQQEKQDAYKQMEYGIKLQKEQRDALTASEKDINEGIAKVSEAANKIPAAGYASMPTALTAMVGKARQSFGNFARSGASITERNIMERQYIDVFNNFAQTGEIMKTANESLAKAKNPDTLAQFVLKSTSLAASPNPDNTVELDIEENGGMLLPKVKSYQKNENGELELTQSLPLEQMNAIATIGNYEGVDYMKEAEDRFKSIGINDVDVMQKGGGKKTIINPKGQENYQRTREDYINWAMMNHNGDAYMKLVKSATDKADYLMEGATDAQRKNIATSQAVKDVKDAKIIYVSRNSKVGGFRAELTPEMDKKLRDKLGEVFDNMSPYKVDVTTPSSTTFNSYSTYKTEESKPLFEGALKGDENKIRSLMDFARLNGSIYPEPTIEFNGEIGEGGKIITRPKESAYTFDKKNNMVSVWVLKANAGDPNDPNDYEKVKFNLKDEDIARYWFSKLAKARELEADSKASSPEIVPHIKRK